MADDFRWEDPPAQRWSSTEGWMEQLRERPERWALVREEISAGTVTWWSRRYPDFEFTMRQIGWSGRDGIGRLYARYVPPRPAEKPACHAPGCDRPVIARGLCMMHYKRVRAGKPLEMDRDGHPAGFGQYGALEVDEDAVLCHECGERFPSLGAHLRSHGLTAREYKSKYGLPLGSSLLSGRLKAETSERSRARLDTAAWRRFEAARDPVMAAHSRTEESYAAIGTAVARDGRSVRNGKRGRKYRVVACPVCGAEWCPLPGGYRTLTCSPDCWRILVRWIRLAAPRQNHPRDRQLAQKWESGLTYSDLADQYGITTVRVGQIIHDHLQPGSLSPDDENAPHDLG